MIRRFGDAPEPGRRYIRRPGAYAILPLDGGLVMTHQAEPEPEIQLPGGGIDPGESPVSALHREVFEETGWHIGTPRWLGTFRRFAYMPEYDIWAEKICMIYVARPTVCIGPPSEPGHMCLWLPENVAIDAPGNPGDRHFVRKYLAATRDR